MSKYKNNRTSETIEPSKVEKPIIGKYIIVDQEIIFIEDEN